MKFPDVCVDLEVDRVGLDADVSVVVVRIEVALWVNQALDLAQHHSQCEVPS